MSALEKVRKGIPRTTSHADVSQQESLLDNQTIPSLSEARNLLWPSFRSPGLSRQSFKGRRWYFFSFRYFFSEVSALSAVHEECTGFECGYKSDFELVWVLCEKGKGSPCGLRDAVSFLLPTLLSNSRHYPGCARNVTVQAQPESESWPQWGEAIVS